MWLKKNSKINKRGNVYFALKSEHYFYKLIFKYFVDSIFSENKNKYFDFKLNVNKPGQTYKFKSLLKNISPGKWVTVDRGDPCGGTIDSFINSGVFSGWWYVKRF